MSESKYVIIQGMFGQHAVVFDKCLQHQYVSNHAVAGGFVSFSKNKDGKIEVYSFGESLSLNVHSRGGIDDLLICQALNGNFNEVSYECNAEFVPAPRLEMS